MVQMRTSNALQIGRGWQCVRVPRIGTGFPLVQWTGTRHRSEEGGKIIPFDEAKQLMVELPFLKSAFNGFSGLVTSVPPNSRWEKMQEALDAWSDDRQLPESSDRSVVPRHYSIHREKSPPLTMQCQARFTCCGTSAQVHTSKFWLRQRRDHKTSSHPRNGKFKTQHGCRNTMR